MPDELKSPFKFLDSFVAEDIDRYFGRDKEVSELYKRLRSNRVSLVYGASGTGKTSLIQCGLFNYFESTEWLPIMVRRSDHILTSISQSLYDTYAKKSVNTEKVSDNSSLIPETEDEELASLNWGEEDNAENLLSEEEFIQMDMAEQFETLYYHFYRPIYLIIDQFEELYTINPHLASADKKEDKNINIRQKWKKEQIEFYQQIRSISSYDKIVVKILIVMREEWLAYLNTFERFLPSLFDNRMRIEKMSDQKISSVIQKTISFSKKKNEFMPVDIQGEGTIDTILETIRDKKDLSIDLIDMQIYLQRLFEQADRKKEKKEKIINSELVKKNTMETVLGDFIQQQLQLVEKALVDKWKKDDPDASLEALKKKADNVPLEILFLLTTDSGTKKVLDQKAILAHRFFQNRDLKEEDLLFCLEKMQDIKLINAYE